MKAISKKSIAGLVVVFLAAAGGTAYYFSGQDNEEEATTTTSSSKKYSVVKAENNDVVSLDYASYNIDSASEIYDLNNQTSMASQVATLKNQDNYSFDNILQISNPYQTNTTGLYVYFTTEEASKISYKIAAKGYSDFSETLYNAEGEYATTHEYQIIGAVPGVENKITLTATTADGTETSQTITYTPPKLQTTDSVAYKATDGDSKTELTEGLYTVIGNKGASHRAIYLVDNEGVIRGEIPILSYNSLRLNFTDSQEMYYAASATKIAKVNNLGQVTNMYDTSAAGYDLHHDFVLDHAGNILALATSKEAKKSEDKLVEDRIIKIDTTTGAISESVDFATLLPDLYSVATGLDESTNNIGYWDPVHINSIQYTGDDEIIVSSRETSTIMKISNISSENPTVDYFISDPSVWEGIGNYSDLVLEKTDDFTNQAGQHTVTYETDDSLEEGQYYLIMFDNNIGLMDSRSDFDWSNYTDLGSSDDSDSVSRYYKYLVDENAGTYTLVDSFDVPYSGFISSVQNIGDNKIVDSGQQAIFAEYDENNELIREFSDEDSTFIYRVFKYDYNNFYFRD